MEVAPATIELSIVVAAGEAGPGLRRCLAALRPQVDPARMEVIVANGSTGEQQWRDDSPWLRALRLRPGTDVPHLCQSCSQNGWNSGVIGLTPSAASQALARQGRPNASSRLSSRE